MTKVKIAIVDDDQDVLTILEKKLQLKGYEVQKISNSMNAMRKLQDNKPDLIILDVMMPHLNGFQLCKKLRDNFSTCLIPIVFLTAQIRSLDKLTGLKIGDDYITKPVNVDELEARIESILRKSRRDLLASPLTGLPGNISIENIIINYIKSGKKFAVGYLDIDNFKAYNDKYGYDKGDYALKSTSQILTEAMKKNRSKNNFIGHIGGDDFIVITSPGTIDKLCQYIITSFDSMIPLLYDDKDREQKYIVGQDRKGKLQKFPLMSLSIAVVSNEIIPISHHGEIAEIAAELKSYAKSQKGSIYVKNRRKK